MNCIDFYFLNFLTFPNSMQYANFYFGWHENSDLCV